MKVTGLAGRLKAARKQAAMTQREVAERVGCSRHSISDYETGRSAPDARRLAEIAAALGVPVAFFFPTPSLLPGEPVRVMTPEQAVELQAGHKGRPRAGGWFMVRPEEWSERMGGIVWVEVTPESSLAAVYAPGSVLGIVHGAALQGARAIAVISDRLVAGEVAQEGRRRMFISSSSRLEHIGEGGLLGSVAVIIEPAAARALRTRARKQK
jgi:transcriptional regulator with XRE-family HTH domain